MAICGSKGLNRGMIVQYPSPAQRVVREEAGGSFHCGDREGVTLFKQQYEPCF